MLGASSDLLRRLRPGLLLALAAGVGLVSGLPVLAQSTSRPATKSKAATQRRVTPKAQGRPTLPSRPTSARPTRTPPPTGGNTRAGGAGKPPAPAAAPLVSRPVAPTQTANPVATPAAALSAPIATEGMATLPTREDEKKKTPPVPQIYIDPAAPFLDTYPHLAKHLFEEPDTGIHFGFGVTPVRLLKNKAGLAVSIFQLHWMSSLIDWELFNASYGTTLAGDPFSKVNTFTFRTSPKFRVSNTISIGPVVGLEFVSFPEVRARLGRDGRFTPFEPFSAKGLIYGVMASQNFSLGRTILKLNQVVYRQTYDPAGTFKGWGYFFEDNALNDDTSPIGPGVSILLEVSLLF